MRDSLVRGTVPSRASRSPPIPSAHAEWGDGVEGNDHFSSIEKQKRALWRITTAQANQTTAQAGSKTAGLAKFPRRMSWEMLGEQGVQKGSMAWLEYASPRYGVAALSQDEWQTACRFALDVDHPALAAAASAGET